MNLDKIYSLETTIRKRLGKKANLIWNDAKTELEIVEILKKHLHRSVSYKYGEVHYQKDAEQPYKVDLSIYSNYYRQKADQETIEQITLWLKENIDKERILELLNVGKDIKAIEILKPRIKLKEGKTKNLIYGVNKKGRSVIREGEERDVLWIEASGFVFKDGEEYKILKEVFENKILKEVFENENNN